MEKNKNLTQETLSLLNTYKFYTYKHIPYTKKGNPAVYLITFPNGKRYVGSSNHVFKRINTHLANLENPDGKTDWYEIATKENNIKKRDTYNTEGIILDYYGEFKVDEEFLAHKFNLTVPRDPRNEYDKSGHRMGNRVSKKKLAQYEEDCKEWKRLKEESGYNKEYNRLQGIIDSELQPWERRQKIVDKLIINIYYCENYREVESSILKSIPEDNRIFWYNSVFS